MTKNINVPDARQVALNVLSSVWNDGAYANIALNSQLNKYKLPDLERRFATELSYGAVKAGLTLDLILQKFVSRPLKKIPKQVLNILRLGIYQIFFSDKIPDSAACNESVKMVRRYGHEGTVKFANAVLRSAIRWKDNEGVASDKEIAEAIFLQHPSWLVKRWTKQIGEEQTRELCRLNNLPATSCLRTNTLKLSREKLEEILTDEDVDVFASHIVPEALLCDNLPPLLKLASFQQGLYQVQEKSSMFVGHYVDAKEGQFVLDLCAAPGGKTTHIAALMHNKGKIIASDIHEHKLKIINANCKRLGIDIVDSVLHDATVLNQQWLEKADRVLVDAPCSGLGVLRRRADLRWHKSEADLAVFPKLQRQILDNAAKYVAKGGKLIYSTCTTETAENMDLVNGFLAENKEYVIEKIKHPCSEEMLDYLQLWTHIDYTDGFFICVLKRI